jgi:hypothetical protein
MNNVMETRHYHTYTEPPHTELGRVLHSVVKSFHKRLSHPELSGTLIRLRAYDDRIRHPHGPCNPWNMLQRMGLANSYDQRKLHFEVDMPRYKKVSIARAFIGPFLNQYTYLKNVATSIQTSTKTLYQLS